MPLDPQGTLDAAKTESVWALIISGIGGGTVVQVFNALFSARKIASEARGKDTETDLTVAGGWKNLYEEMKTRVNELEIKYIRSERECKGKIELLEAQMDELRLQLHRRSPRA